MRKSFLASLVINKTNRITNRMFKMFPMVCMEVKVVGDESRVHSSTVTTIEAKCDQLSTNISQT